MNKSDFSLIISFCGGIFFIIAGIASVVFYNVMMQKTVYFLVSLNAEISNELVLGFYQWGVVVGAQSTIIGHAGNYYYIPQTKRGKTGKNDLTDECQFARNSRPVPGKINPAHS